MSKSITTKIIISYLIIVLASMTFVGLFFNFTAKGYMEKQAKNNLLRDATVIAEIFKKDISSEGEANETNIRQLIRERLKKSSVESGNHYAIVTRDLRVLFPRDSEEIDVFKTQILPKLKEKMVSLKKGNFKIKADGKEYLTAVLPIPAAKVGNVMRGWVVIYTSVGPMNELERGMMLVLVLALAFTSVLALVFGIFFARSVTRPIIVLKDRAEKLSKRDFDSRVEICTGDELEQLANTINKMAVELKEYDIAQKRFLQNASHELKTPLMSIQGYAEGVKDGVFEDNEKALDVIVDESVRMKNIVEELTFLSKLETMEDFYKYSIESMNDIIQKSVEKVNSLAVKNNIKINQMLYKDGHIRVDRDKFTQALINILGNCLRYARNEIGIITSNDGKYFEITICDDGEGFEEKELKNVFERFYKGKKGNTGLGLAITKVIVEKHGGTIEVANTKEGGAEFKIKLEIR